MFCTNCGKAIDESAKVCPYCNAPVEEEVAENKSQRWEGPINASGYEDYPPEDANNGSGNNEKKKKNITLIVSLIVTAIIIIAGVVCYFLFLHESVVDYINGGNDTVQDDDDEDDDDDDEEDKDKDKEDDDDNDVVGGEDESTTVVPEPENSEAAEFYIEMSSTLTYCTFDVTEDSIEFINNNEKFFPCAEADFEALSQSAMSRTYPELSKSVAKYDAEIVNTDYMCVSQIYETENGEYTYLSAYDNDGNGYVGVLYGVADGVYEGDYVKIYGTPLAKVDFANYYGGSEPGIFFAISYCEKMTDEEYEEQNLIEQLQSDPISYFMQNGYYEPDIYQVKTKTGDNLRMRSWCTTEEDNVVTLLKHESLVYVYGFYNGWAYVTTYEGEYFEGWVSEDYVFPYYEY